MERTLVERVARAGMLIKVQFHITRRHADLLRRLASDPRFADVLTRYGARDGQPAKRLAAYLLEQAIDDQIGRVELPSDGGSSS